MLPKFVAAFRSNVLKYTGPKVRISRQLGVALTPKAAKVLERKPYGPGQHGPAKQFRRSRPSPYKEQLIEKQKLRAQYNIHEKQMRRYYEKATKREGNSADNLIALLETRLDNIVLRGGLARTIYQARQIVNHGHIVIDGQRVNIPSYNVRPGQVVSVRGKSSQMQVFQDALASVGRIPGYVAVNEATLSITLSHLPRLEEVNVFAEVPKVIEYYSR